MASSAVILEEPDASRWLPASNAASSESSRRHRGWCHGVAVHSNGTRKAVRESQTASGLPLILIFMHSITRTTPPHRSDAFPRTHGPETRHLKRRRGRMVVAQPRLGAVLAGHWPRQR